MKSDDSILGLDNWKLFGKYSWPQVTKTLLIIMIFYAFGSIFISNPFMYRIGKESIINYSNIMYAHGLTVGLASILSLVACQIFNMNYFVRKYILLFSIIGILIGVVAGSFNRSIEPPYWLWFQVLSFFCLDAVFVLLIVGFISIKNNQTRKTLTYWAGLTSAFSFLIAAITGDIAGWILDFGGWPSIIPWWSHFVGFESVDKFMSRLIRAHSHIMVASVFSFISVIISFKYGNSLISLAKKIKILGEFFVILGLILTNILFLSDGYGGPYFQTPKVFTSAPLTDIVVSVCIMGGGTLIVLAIFFGKRHHESQVSNPMRTAINSIAMTWFFMFLILAVIGVMMDVNASDWNSHGNGALNLHGFSFRFLHQDLTFILFPALIVVMILVQHWLNPKIGKLTNTLLRLGVISCFIGTIIYVFINPDLKGPGYWVISLGFFIIVLALFYFLKNGKFKENDSLDISKN